MSAIMVVPGGGMRSAGRVGGRLRAGIADLHPAYAALVMATGIVSTGLALFGWTTLSDVLLVAAGIAFAVLLMAYVWRVAGYPGRALDDVRDPGRAFGYFTLVAAANVVGVRVAMDHHLRITAVLGLASVPVWLLLTYSIPGALIVGRRQEAVLPRAYGSWFMWVVGTQSPAAAAATVASAYPGLRASLAPLAVALWGVGVVLYLMLAGLLLVTLLDDAVAPHALSPTYWVYMGATAITVLAGSRILALRATLPVLVSTRQVVSGVAFLLWAFGTRWIPLLAVFGVWRLFVHGEPVHYEPTLWSMVFPLGMYGVASVSYGRQAHLRFRAASRPGACPEQPDRHRRTDRLLDARRRGRHLTGIALSGVGLGLTVCAEYLGGHLTLVQGVGVDHTAFEPGVTDWTDVAAADDLSDAKLVRVTAGGVAVVLVAAGRGVPYALSADCVHASGPLDQGTIVDDGCFRCSWHGSVFRLADGKVVRGPASVYQPSWEVKVEKGRVHVRSAAAGSG